MVVLAQRQALTFESALQVCRTSSITPCPTSPKITCIAPVVSVAPIVWVWPSRSFRRMPSACGTTVARARVNRAKIVRCSNTMAAPCGTTKRRSWRRSTNASARRRVSCQRRSTSSTIRQLTRARWAEKGAVVKHGAFGRDLMTAVLARSRKKADDTTSAALAHLEELRDDVMQLAQLETHIQQGYFALRSQFARASAPRTQ